MQRQKAVFAYFTSEQILPFAFAERYKRSAQQLQGALSTDSYSAIWLKLPPQPATMPHQRQTAVTAYFSSKQLPLFVFAAAESPVSLCRQPSRQAGSSRLVTTQPPKEASLARGASSVPWGDIEEAGCWWQRAQGCRRGRRRQKTLLECRGQLCCPWSQLDDHVADYRSLWWYIYTRYIVLLPLAHYVMSWDFCYFFSSIFFIGNTVSLNACEKKKWILLVYKILSGISQ